MSDDGSLQSARCPLGCDSPVLHVLDGIDRLHGISGRFRVVECGGCGLMRTDPRPTPASIARYYPHDYGPHQDSGEPASARSTHSRLRRLIQRWSDHRGYACPPLAPGRLLEVGCGRGEFLSSKRDEGWTVFGQEIAARTEQALARRNIEYHLGPIASLPLGRKFDLIAGFMVLEHLHDPIGDLRHLRGLAAEHAYLVVSTPNVRSIDFKLFRSRWFGLQLPTHLYHYDPTTLAKVLAAAGWKVERVLHQRTMSDTLASLAYLLRDIGAPSMFTDSLSRYPEAPLRLRRALAPVAAIPAALRRSSRITVWARAT